MRLSSSELSWLACASLSNHRDRHSGNPCGAGLRRRRFEASEREHQRRSGDVGVAGQSRLVRQAAVDLEVEVEVLLSDQSDEVAVDLNRLVEGRRPEQTGALEKTWSKVRPCAAIASMCGVLAPPGKRGSSSGSNCPR